MSESGDVRSDSLQLYEAQFFGFTPETCTVRVHSAFRDTLSHILVSVESVFIKRLSPGQEPPAQLKLSARESCLKLRQFLEERFKVMFQRMRGMLMDHVLSIPPKVLLPGDENQQKHQTGQNELQKIQDSITSFLRSYEAEVCAKQALLSELQEQEEAQRHLEEQLKWIQELQLLWRREGLGSVPDGLSQMMKTLGQVHDVMGTIRLQSKALDDVCSS